MYIKMYDRPLAYKLVDRVYYNKKHMAVYKPFKLVMDDNFIFSLYINNELKLISGDHGKIAEYVYYSIENWIKENNKGV